MALGLELRGGFWAGGARISPEPSVGGSPVLSPGTPEHRSLRGRRLNAQGKVGGEDSCSLWPVDGKMEARKREVARSSVST